MAAAAGNWRRTHSCGELRHTDVGKTVTLNGWVAARRNHGGIYFIDLRDRYGLTQVVLDEKLSATVKLGGEYVISVTGPVHARDAANVNPDRETGRIELVAERLEVLSPSRTPAFVIDGDEEVSTETRLKFRYLDLRRSAMQKNLAHRARLISAMRKAFEAQGFIEVETPILTKATPEGARDVLRLVDAGASVDALTAAAAGVTDADPVARALHSALTKLPVTGRLTPGKTPSAPMPVSADPKYADGIPNTVHEPVPASNEPFAMLPASTEQTSLVFQRGQTMSKAKAFIRKKKDPKYCYNFAENPNVWMVEAYAGPSFNKRSLQAGIPAFESYAQMRRNTEHPDWSFNAGVRGALLLKRHWLLRTGLHYEQMTEVFEYADPSYIKYIVEIINQPGEPTIIDTVGVEYGENYVKTFNRYGMIDVPLEMGAELRSGRFGLSLHAGLSVNVFFWKRGTVLSPGNQPKPFTPGAKDATEIFRTRTGLSATGSAQMFVHLKPTVRVFAEPYFRKVLKLQPNHGNQWH